MKVKITRLKVKVIDQSQLDIVKGESQMLPRTLVKT